MSGRIELWLGEMLDRGLTFYFERTDVWVPWMLLVLACGAELDRLAH